VAQKAGGWIFLAIVLILAAKPGLAAAQPPAERGPAVAEPARNEPEQTGAGQAIRVPVPQRHFYFEEQYYYPPTSPSDPSYQTNYLLGDWLGYRSELARQGITPTLTWVSDMLGNPIGGQRQGFTEFDNTGLDIHFDLEKLLEINKAQFHVSMSQRSGSSLTRNYIGNTFNVQQVCCGSTFRLVDVDYEQKFCEETVDVRLGRFAQGDEYLFSPYYTVFVNNGFCGNPVGIFFNVPGFKAYPTATWGARLRVNPSERTYVSGGVFNGDPDLGDNDVHGADFSFKGPLFAILEAAYIHNGAKTDEGMVGNYKAGIYYNGGTFDEFITLAPCACGSGVAAGTQEGNYGFYVLADQVIYRLGPKGTRQGAALFGCFLFAPDENINTFPFFFNGGLVFRGLVPRRPEDFGGFGVIYGDYSSDLQESQVLQGLAPQEYEIVLEWTYSILMAPGLRFQPDVQYILKPGGTGDIPNAVALGFQVAVSF
jgi:porin